MANKALVWDQVGEKLFETGTQRGVLFPVTDDGNYGKGVAWNGLRSVDENPSGAEETALYADDNKYLSLRSKEEFSFTIGAYTYPDEFAECDGSKEIVPGVTAGQQARRTFGFSYTTKIGNDIVGDGYSEKIHLVYGCSAAPSSKSYSTVNDSPEAIEFSWEVNTVPVDVDGMNKTAHITIDCSKFKSEGQAAKLEALKKMLYGSDEGEGNDPTLPTPAQLKELLA